MPQTNADYDSPWKMLIELYFRDFISFFFPWIEPEIDWTHPIKFLDKELQQVVRDAEIGKRYVDKLVEVYKTSGNPALVLCHVEVQSQPQNIFPKRMFTYNYRLRDGYDCAVISLAILGDESELWRPTNYQDELWRCSIHFEFPTVKLLDYADNWQGLEESQNPFAVAVMAHLKTKETQGNPVERKAWKYTLTTMLYDRGYSEQDILNLHNFLDWMIALPEGLEREFQLELAQFEEARAMRYVTTGERMAEERGMRKGEEQARQSLALRMLREGASLEFVAKVTEFSIEQIQQLQTETSE